MEPKLRALPWLAILLLSCGNPDAASHSTAFTDRAANSTVGETGNVILITLDGVRAQEFFNGPDPTLSPDETAPTFPRIQGQLAQGAFTAGNPAGEARMEVANPAQVSLPGYQSIFSGRVQPCMDNQCSRIQDETFPERMVRDLGLRKDEVAAIGTWGKLDHALERREGSIFVNTGLTALDDGTSDPVFASINESQAKDPPEWHDARKDVYTFLHSLHYLEKWRPRFLFIGFGDADSLAHRRRYPEYLGTLREYDRYISILIQALDEMGEYGRNTTVLVTTDHGRGHGREWSRHKRTVPGSGDAWLWVRGPRVRAGSSRSDLSHLDLRPTIEALVGLAPQGLPIAEVLSARD